MRKGQGSLWSCGPDTKVRELECEEAAYLPCHLSDLEVLCTPSRGNGIFCLPEGLQILQCMSFDYISYCRAALQRSDRKEPRYKWPTLLYRTWIKIWGRCYLHSKWGNTCDLFLLPASCAPVTELLIVEYCSVKSELKMLNPWTISNCELIGCELQVCTLALHSTFNGAVLQSNWETVRGLLRRKVRANHSNWHWAMKNWMKL